MPLVLLVDAELKGCGWFSICKTGDQLRYVGIVGKGNMRCFLCCSENVSKLRPVNISPSHGGTVFPNNCENVISGLEAIQEHRYTNGFVMANTWQLPPVEAGHTDQSLRGYHFRLPWSNLLHHRRLCLHGTRMRQLVAADAHLACTVGWH